MDTSGASFGSGLARVTSAIISITFRVCSVCGRLPGDDVLVPLKSFERNLFISYDGFGQCKCLES